MRFQKILMLVTLIVSALTFVYALIFSTPISALSVLTHGQPTITNDPIGANATYDLFQQYNAILVVLTVVFILLVALCYIMACQKRRNYYTTNYVAIIATAAYALVLCVLIVAFTAICHMSFLNDVDWYTYYNDYYNGYLNVATGYTLYSYSDSDAVCWIGYVIAFIVLADVVALVYNLIWKVKLMKGEKQLLANGLVKGVA